MNSMSIFNGVKVNVADQLQQIRIFLAYDGFVSVLKKVSMPALLGDSDRGVGGPAKRD